jgi:hypothetical protein
MSQVLHDKPEAPQRSGAEAGASGRPRRRLAIAVVALGLLLGGAAGWTASTLLADDPDARVLTAQTARLQGAAERYAEQAEQRAEAQRWEVERRRWEAQADHFDPGWRDR